MTLPPEREPGPAVRRRVRPLAILLVAAACAVGIVAVVAATTRPATTFGPQLACRDVATSVGLQFTGDYGPVLPAPDAYGTLMQQNMGNGAAVGDYDGDGYLDVLLLGQAGHQTRLFHNVPAPDGGRRYTDVTDAAGLTGVTSNARVAQFVDLSGSGRPDIVIAADYVPGGPGGPSQILRNTGDGTFEDVTAGSGFEPAGYIVGGMTFADYDGTGRQSIYLSYWTEELAGDPARQTVKGAFPGQNRLYQNLGDYHFKDVTYETGLGEYHADSFSAVFADFTDDGLADLYQANDHRADRFYKNVGGGTFQEAGDAAGLTRAGNSMGVATTIGADGMLRLYVTNITDPSGLYGSNLGNTYMVSEPDPGGVRFRNAAAQYGILDTAWGWGTSFVDMNLDGAPDLFAVQGMRAFVGTGSAHLANATSTLFLGGADGSTFSVAKDTGCDVPGDQRALVVFDYDRDGSPDLLITQVAGPAVLLQNATDQKHWLTVAPEGLGDAGVNARITVTAGGRTTEQILLAGGSYLAGPPREAYFGLDTTPRADLVRIDWANGTTTALRDVTADQVLRVSPPSS